MGRRKMSREAREQWWSEEERRVWGEFRTKLEAVNTFAEAVKLVYEAVPPDSPGRKYYSNLGFFLHSFGIPAGSGYTEKALYIELVGRMDAAGNLKPGVRERVVNELREAMEKQGSWSG